jgi:hypothetical protein
MNKITIRFTPKPEDYSRAIRIHSSARQTILSVFRGFASVLILFMLVTLVIDIFHGDFQSILFYFPVLLVFLLLFFLPALSGWLTDRRVSKQTQLLQTVTYEFDDEKIHVLNQVAESKLDWSFYNKTFDADQYYIFVYATNKNMFQFLPKRAFESPAQEGDFRSLIEQKLGKIDNIQKGLRGWKLSLLAAVLMVSGIILCGLVYFIFSFFLE